MAADRHRCQSSSQDENYGSGFSQNNEGNPEASGHIKGSPSNNKRKRVGPWHHTQGCSPREVLKRAHAEPNHQSSVARHPRDRKTYNVFHQSRDKDPNHQNSIGPHPHDKKAQNVFHQSRHADPNHQCLLSGHPQDRKAQNVFHQSRDNDPNRQSSVTYSSQDIRSQNLFHSQGNNCTQFAGVKTDYLTNRSGGWLEEENFVCPRKGMDTSGYANEQMHMQPTNHVIQKHSNEKPEHHYRRSFRDNHSPQFQESNFRRNAHYKKKYDAMYHNRAKQEASHNHHSCDLSYVDHRSNDGLNHLHKFEMDRYIGHTNASGLADKQINPMKNLQEPFHSNANLMEDEEEQEEEDEDEDEDDSASDSEKDMAIQKVHLKLLPKVKEVVDKVCGSAKPSLVGNVELSCLVCSPVQHFKGWKALLAHAQSFRKRKVIQHRGYYQALDSVLKVKEDHGQGKEQEMPIAVHASFIDPNLSECHLIVWPPVVVIERTDSRSHLSQSKLTSKGTQITQGEGTMEDTAIQMLISQELQDLHPKDIIPCGRSQSVILFEASSLGYMEAKVLSERLRERKRGREDWLRFMDHGPSLSREYHGRTTLLFGYLAEPADLKIIDPNRTIVKEWSEESYGEKVHGANKRMKQEHEHKQAKLKAIELEVVTLSEEEQTIKIHKQVISSQIQIKDKEIEEQQDQTRIMREHFAEEDRRLFKIFEAVVSRVNEEGSAKERELREQLERDEKLHKEERNSRMKQIEMRHLALRELKKSYEKLAEEKALDREAEVMVRQKNFMEEVRKAEAHFNAQIQGVESSLQIEQQDEMTKLAEESEREREAFYQEWMKENETMKKKVEELKKNKEQVQKENEKTPECAVCWECLTPENRALLDPCGHTQVCIECAQAVFTTKKGCPLCREKIAKKPIRCPKSLFGASD